MRKSFRTAAVITMVAALAGGTVFAQASNNANNSKSSENSRRAELPFPNDGHHMMPRHFGGNRDCMNPQNEKDVLIGQITSVNTTTGAVKVKNADGKEVEIRVSPFTRIMIHDPESVPKFPSNKEAAKNSENEKQPPFPFKKHSVSDLKKGAWVMVRSYGTNTKIQEASSVMVLQKDENSSSLSDAK